MEKGDALVLHPVGAYNVVQSMQFIMYRPAVAMIRPDGECVVIREKENLECVEAQERMPDSMKSIMEQ